MIEFDPPLVAIPSTVTGGQPVRSAARLSYYNRLGRRLFSGTVERTIRFEGFETVTVEGTKYEDCVRLAAETHYRIPLVAWVDTEEYVWLAPGLGDVRTMRRYHGLTLLTSFDERQRLDLVTVEVPEDAVGARSDVLAPPRLRNDSLGRLHRLAFFIQPTLPRPLLAGLIAEFADSP